MPERLRFKCQTVFQCVAEDRERERLNPNECRPIFGAMGEIDREDENQPLQRESPGHFERGTRLHKAHFARAR